jgi:hypothetical protein
LYRRTLAVVAMTTVLQTLPSVAATSPGVVTALVRSTVLTTGHTALGLTDERMVGVTWTAGQPAVRVRWHSAHGWSAWEAAEDDSRDSPEGTPGTAPVWRPKGADRVEVHTAGDAQGLRLVRVADGMVRRVHGAVAHAASGRAVLGAVHPRSDWGADEGLVRGSPSYAPRVDAVTVHHTANANGYSREDVPAVIRADYAYHVRTRGWADLGYNLLVDRFGGIWEGRRGGLGRAVVGAHAQGFNAGTLGVALIGDLTRTAATREAEKALARVVGYAATTWGFDPTGTVTLTSRGSPRYANGRRVTLPRVFGHQETSVTACPGSLQGDLPRLRQLAEVAMLPAPRVLGTTLTGVPLHAPSPATLDARLSTATRWRATITDPQGGTVVTTTGSSASPTLTWDGFASGLPALPGRYGWRLKVDDGFHPAVTRSGGFDVGLPLLRLNPPSARP